MGKGAPRETEAFVARSSGAHVSAKPIVHMPVKLLKQMRWAPKSATSTSRGSGGGTTDELKERMAEDGVVEALTVGLLAGKPTIYDGHHRLDAADELGWTHLPVAIHESAAGHLSPDQIDRVRSRLRPAGEYK
jgi:hypothetical protein